MEIDLFDAMRVHLLVEIDCEGVRYKIEPDELHGSRERPALVAYAVEGPELGWSKFPDWSKLRIARKHFTPRERPTA